MLYIVTAERKRKMNKLFSKVAALSVGLALAIGVGVAFGSRQAKEVKATDDTVIVVDSDTTSLNLTSTATSEEVSRTDASGITYKVSSGAKQQTSSGSNKFTAKAILIGKSGAYIYNTTVMPDNIKKFELYANAGASAKVSVAVQFANSTDGAIEDFDSELAGTWTQTLSTLDNVYDVTLPMTNARYFRYQVTNANNSQVEFRITCGESQTVTSATFDMSSAKTNYVEGDDVSISTVKVLDNNSNDITSACTITADKEKVAFGDTSITYSATYNFDESIQIESVTLPISVAHLAVTSIEPYGKAKTSFVEEQPISYGSMKVKVNYNNETSETLNMDHAGISVMIGSETIVGTRYLSVNDNEKTITVSYSGFSFDYQITVASKSDTPDGYWTKITDASEFVEGLEVILVSNNTNYAMGTYATGNNVPAVEVSKDESGNINGTVAGVQTYTLELSDGETSVDTNTFALYDGTGYLYAPGGSNNNYLKRSATIDSEKVSQYSFALTTSSAIANTGEGQRNVLKYNANNGNPIFSCYAGTSSNPNAVLYKFVEQPKSADQIVVENFCKVSLHLDSSSSSYVDFNDNTSGTACLSYYQSAKTAYEALTDDQKDIFATSAEFIIARGRDRFAAWAKANGETFDAVAGTFSAFVPSFAFILENNNTMIIVISIAAISALGLTFALVFKKKKQK